MKNFLIKLILFSLVIAALDFCWIRFAPVQKHIPHIWPMLAFFMLMTTLFHFWSMQASKGRPQNFIRHYMGATALRLFLYIAIIVAYLFYDKPTLKPFAIGFMIHYFVFTAFEVPVLLRELRNGGGEA